MAAKTVKKPAARPRGRSASGSSGSRRAPQRKDGIFRPARLLYFLGLLILLAFSIGMVGYVIFFRTVVAAELPSADSGIIFEEPLPEAHPEPHWPESPASDPVALPQVAIIIDDMGFHPRIGRRLLELDLNLSFSFLPYAPHTGELEETAYQLGRTVLMHLPLEPVDPKWDPGPDALYLDQSPAERKRLLERNLMLVPHATGISSHMGSRYSESRVAMDELAGYLKARDLFFVDSYTSASSQGLAAARSAGVPATRRDVFLDNVQQVQAICRQLEKLVRVAGRQGWAVGIGHPYPETLEALNGCGAELLAGVELVAVQDLWR